MSVQYRLALSKKDERVDGPDDAAIVVTVPLVDVVGEGFDATVAYMQGRLKSAGPTGPLLELLRSGEVDRRLRTLAGAAPT
jgi:hypothetical protein